MSLEAAVDKCKDEPFFTNWKVFFKEDTLDVAKSCLDALVAPIIDCEDPREGVIAYAYSRSEQQRDDSVHKNCVYFTELFADLQSFQTHLTEAEAEPVVELFKCVSGRVVGYVNSPLWHEGIKSAIVSQQVQPARTTVGHTLNPHPKGLLGGKWGRKLLPEANQAIMIELRVDPNSKETSDRLLALLSPLTKITKTDFNMISSYIIQGPGWWRRDESAGSNIKLKTKDAKIPKESYTNEFGSPDAIDFRMICSRSMALRHKFPRSLVTELVEIIQVSKSSEFIITAENLKDESLTELLEYFEDHGLLTSDKRSLLSGFLLHPYFTKSWKGGTKIESLKESLPKQPNDKEGKIVGALTQKNSSGLSTENAISAAPNKKDSHPSVADKPIFQIRHHAVKNQPEAVVLKARARACPSSSDCFVVPLIDYLRTVTRLSHADKEVPIGTLFGVLERMRSMVADVAYINRLVKISELEREAEANLSRVQAVFNKLNLMGRGEYQKEFGRKLLSIDGLEKLISAIEKEYAPIVDSAKRTVADGAAIEYLGLQELYKINSVVTTRSIPGLGGLLVSFKVVDCFYEPIRSLMGSLRYSFKITLETIVNAGQHFIAVPFTETIGDWKNVKDLSVLPFQPLKDEVKPFWIENRTKMINSLNNSKHSFSYMEYPAGSFFPSLGGRKGKSSGASSSSVMRAASGQVIIDIKTGLNLGYASTSRTGELGIVMGHTMKLYLDFIRKATHSKVNLEDLNGTGYITAYETFPENAQPWPCVIGFSMTTKSWGYAVVDQLVPVLPDSRPWSELVLPSASREMLMSLAEEKILRSGQSRYRYDDLIAGKGSGGLYLLYGPPGTGKTLTVEALARYFGKPLYSISFAELGSSTAELEETLTVTLGLAAHWGSLVLLDEGDALVEKRKQGQLLLNSMTGVLLRILETFEGSLFINSNRVSSFDPAALSRVTLAVKFSPLTKEGMKKVWQSTIARVLDSDTTRSLTYEEALVEAEKDFDLSKLSKFPGSGRSVGAVMKMAIALCSHRECDLIQEVLQECINNFLTFHTDLQNEGVTESWDDTSKNV